MAYQKTGRPPGRPRKDPDAPQPVVPKLDYKPAPPRHAKPEAPKPVNLPAPHNAAQAPRPGPFRICDECHPDGWPKGWTAAACQHGIWARPWVP